MDCIQKDKGEEPPEINSRLFLDQKMGKTRGGFSPTGKLRANVIFFQSTYYHL